MLGGSIPDVRLDSRAIAPRDIPDEVRQRLSRGYLSRHQHRRSARQDLKFGPPFSPEMLSREWGPDFPSRHHPVRTPTRRPIMAHLPSNSPKLYWRQQAYQLTPPVLISTPETVPVDWPVTAKKTG